MVLSTIRNIQVDNIITLCLPAIEISAPSFNCLRIRSFYAGCPSSPYDLLNNWWVYKSGTWNWKLINRAWKNSKLRSSWQQISWQYIELKDTPVVHLETVLRTIVVTKLPWIQKRLKMTKISYFYSMIQIINYKIFIL